MRALILVPFLAVAACSGEGGEKKEEKAARPASFPAGQWQADFEVENIRSTDKTEPALAAKAGDKESVAACATEGAGPPPELLAGPGYQCQPKNSYVRNGRMTVSLDCTREGIEGQVMMTVDGTYSADTVEGTVHTTTYLPGRGDFEMSRKFSGRRTGDTCTPADTGGAEGNAAGNAAGG